MLSSSHSIRVFYFAVKSTWLLIANTEKALIYQIVRKKYSLVKILTHAESRLKTSDLVTDKPGHYQTSTTRGQFIPPTDLHENEHKVFARELAHYLKESQQKKMLSKTDSLCRISFLWVDKSTHDKIHTFFHCDRDRKRFNSASASRIKCGDSNNNKRHALAQNIEMGRAHYLIYVSGI